ncbi:MAG: helix-turn-helix domain-containing protein [Pseudomonadota bacterium]
MDALSSMDAARGGSGSSPEAFGAEVRQLRKARQMTLAELRDATAISISHLSAIERGAANPSLAMVSRIAAALGVPEEWFFARRPGAGPLERAYVVREANRRNLNLLYGETVEQAGYSDALLSSSIGGGFYMGLSDYPPHSEQVVDHYYTREGEMHGLVLEGELELRLEDEIITLRAGDSFSFPGDIVHSARNFSDRRARLLWVNAPVIIPQFTERVDRVPQRAETPDPQTDDQTRDHSRDPQGQGERR